MFANSKAVISNQTDLHPNLAACVINHLRHPYQKPIADFNRNAFAQLEHWLTQRSTPIIFDSGCGTGQSTQQLAQQHPHCSVVGIDKSVHRLRREHSVDAQIFSDGGNYCLLHADAVDIWRLALTAGWQLHAHYLLYPNPWPKKKHLQRRWHGHPGFIYLLALGGQLELRSNWPLYLEEFSAALQIAQQPVLSLETFTPQPALTRFEAKYHASNHVLYRGQTQLQPGQIQLPEMGL